MAEEVSDQEDFDLILDRIPIPWVLKRSARHPYALLHQEPPVTDESEEDPPIDEEVSSVCPVRKVNPYRMQAKRLQENRIAPNILNRQFKAYGPRTVLLTDITFIPRYSHHEPKLKYTYVCVIMDAFTKEVLACVCSTSYETDFVLDAFNQLMDEHGTGAANRRTDPFGSRLPVYKLKIRHASKRLCSLRQSMSRRGNCWDNAPQESLFGHMKDEIAC
jgi:putative transposase